MLAFKVTDDEGKSVTRPFNSEGICEKQYILNYKVGEITTAEKNSLGIFLFSNFNAAEAYLVYTYNAERIFKVKTIGKKIKRKYMSAKLSYNDFYTYQHWRKRKNKFNFLVEVWDNVLLYPAVKVLEEINYKEREKEND